VIPYAQVFQISATHTKAHFFSCFGALFAIISGYTTIQKFGLGKIFFLCV